MFKTASKNDFAWLLLRQKIGTDLKATNVAIESKQEVPAWSRFNEYVQKEFSSKQRKSTIGYCE